MTALILLASLSVCSVHAAQIHPALQAKMSSAPEKSYSAYLVMADRASEPQLSKSLSLDSYTRQAGHAIAMKHLKEKAHRSQKDILEYLELQLLIGSVTSYKGHWIGDIISITATGDQLFELANRDDIESIYEATTAMLIEPVGSSPAAPTDTVESALRVIGADSMWALGYTGLGRLVCSFDTGVEGTHPALVNTWRGNNGYSWQESWFNPLDGDSFPHVIPSSSNPGHGTHTLGIMVGHDDATGDTVGVAPEAQWIAAAVIDIDGTDVLDAFEWAADPDGNPNTITDVPDVVSNSWGYPQSWINCDDIFWDAVDNLEALGVVMLFSAGNEGSGAQTIRNPANRATTDYNSFAIGMIDPANPSFPVYSKSSRGPSDCDGISLKPQVVAPGVNIRSTWPGASYADNTGTSMACPHVAGAVALLRQYNPNAPVDSIKKALMESAIDVDASGLDNNSGWGLIDIPSALELLIPNNAPSLYISTINEPSPNPGDTFDVILALGNSGLGLTGVEAVLRTNEASAEVVDSSFVFGNIPMDSEADNTAQPYSIAFDDTLTIGTDLAFTLHVIGSGNYSKDIPMIFTAGQLPAPGTRSTFVHDAGSVSFGVSNFGQYGFALNSIFSLSLPGFLWPNDGSGSNNLYEMGLVVGTDADHVSDAVRGVLLNVADYDFAVEPDGDVVFMEPGSKAAQESYCRFNDSRAGAPIGVTVSQHSFAFADSPDDDYVMIVYRVFNTSGSLIEGLRIGILTDWDWPFGGASAGSRDRVGFSASSNTGYMYTSDSIADPDYRGIAILNDFGASAFRAINNDTYLWDGNGFTNSEKWTFLSGGIVSTSTYLHPDHSCMIGAGPFDISAGDSVEVAFALIGASSTNSLTATAVQAKLVYDTLVTDAESPSDNPILPSGFTLYQNFPNPFNPVTSIEFYLDRQQDVKLTVFNLLGQRVTTLADGKLGAGMHRFEWGASEYASGLYFYRLETETSSKIKKMVLLK